MREALEVFINGIIGVYAGLFVLYLAIKLNKLVDRSQASDKDDSA